VTKNAKSVLLTGQLAFIIIYLFSICGFLFLRDDFMLEVEPLAQAASMVPTAAFNHEVCLSKDACFEQKSPVTSMYHTEASDESDPQDKERACDTLLMCILTTLNNGIRNGGGIGDILRKPSTTVSNNGF
jgi:hypothetical protein